MVDTKITGDRIVLISKSTFLWEIGVKENPKDLKVHGPTAEEFQQYLNHIGYTQDYKANDFKKSVVSGLWSVLMHFINKALSGKHG